MTTACQVHIAIHQRLHARATQMRQVAEPQGIFHQLRELLIEMRA